MEVLDFPAYADYSDDYETEPYDMEEHGTELDGFTNEDSTYYHMSDMTMAELWRDCAGIVLVETAKNLAFMFAIAVSLFLVRLILPERYPWRRSVLHLLIAGSGYATLRHLYHPVSLAMLYVTVSGFIGLRVLSFSQNGRVRGLVALTISFVGGCLCETLLDAGLAHRLRGLQMIFMMKVISLAFDNYIPELSVEGLAEYVAYMMLPSNCIFGPWISMADFQKWHLAPGSRNLFSFLSHSFRLLRSLAMSVVALLISDCFAGWLIPDLSNRWVIAYRSALSFRFSHYFICCLSESLMLLAGFPNTLVTKPSRIEMPRSLVDVVKYWNIPMRNWLREYIFTNVRSYGSKPLALFVTYVASSLLHGLNFQLSAVLVSLAFFTYVEHELRRKLATHLDACIEARACRACNHRNMARNPYVLLTNLAFGMLAAFNLTYLGDMFDSSSKAEEGYDYFHTLTKWSQLKFAGHYIMTLCYGIQLLL